MNEFMYTSEFRQNIVHCYSNYNRISLDQQYCTTARKDIVIRNTELDNTLYNIETLITRGDPIPEDNAMSLRSPSPLLCVLSL